MWDIELELPRDLQACTMFMWPQTADKLIGLVTAERLDKTASSCCCMPYSDILWWTQLGRTIPYYLMHSCRPGGLFAWCGACVFSAACESWCASRRSHGTWGGPWPLWICHELQHIWCHETRFCSCMKKRNLIFKILVFRQWRMESTWPIFVAKPIVFFGRGPSFQNLFDALSSHADACSYW